MERKLLTTIALLLLIATLVSGCTVAVPAGADIIAADEVVDIFDDTASGDAVPTETPVQPEDVHQTVAKTDIAYALASPVPTLLVASPVPEASPTPLPTIEPTPEPTIEPTPSPTIEPTPKPTEYEVIDVDDVDGYINAGTANIRKGPSTEFDVIMEVNRYEEIIVTAKSGDWYKIKVCGEKGYVLKEFVELGAVPTPTPTAKPTQKPTPEPTKTPAPSSETEDTPVFSGGSFTSDELYLAAKVVYLEAKGNGLEAYMAVANVLYNRVISSSFPSSLTDVIYQKNQFTVTDDIGEIDNSELPDTVLQAINEIFVNGNLLLPSDVMFFRTASKGTSWGNRVYYATYGANAFFK